MNILKHHRPRRHQRSGQTLTEYALILAYISVLAMQALHYLGEIIQEEYISNQCAFIAAQYYAAHSNDPTTNGYSSSMKNAVLLAIINYLDTPATWQGCDASFAASATTTIIYHFGNTLQ
jgi:Flp pilus assembly pilin Flp